MKVKKDNEINKLVWARLRYCVFWPAKVVDTPRILGKTPINKTCVLFFGTKNFGFVDDDKILDYQSHRAKYIRKGHCTSFKTAVHDMDEYLKDPKKFTSYASVECVSNKVSVKMERDVEQSLGISTEFPLNSKLQATQISDAERDALVQQIADLKDKNQRTAVHCHTFGKVKK